MEYIKKFDKKALKSQHIVEKQTGIKCNLTEAKIIAICNAGLVNGLSQEMVFFHFSKYGTLEKIIMLEGKSCAFVQFSSLESSINAFKNINGKLNIAQDEKPLRLLFAPSLPALSEDLTLPDLHIPPGCVIIPNFISETEELTLLNLINVNKNETSANVLKHRQVYHYGYEFRYDINNVDKDNPLEQRLPQECDFMWERLQSYQVKFHKPDQLTVNYYKPGQGIPPHIDTHSAFEDPILSLSLGASVVMDFRKNNIHIPLLLPRRSLTVMSGECRYAWTHGITPRKNDIIKSSDEGGLQVSVRDTRISFTFRKVLQGECGCEYPEYCDSRIKTDGIDSTAKDILSDSVAEKLEKTHVLDVYDNIAGHFSDTRHKPWPNVLEFVRSFDTGSILIDVGCGNGKYLGQNNNLFDIGCDSSNSLLEICQSRGHQVFTSNCLTIPLLDNIADGMISIAVIHHLANRERRMRALHEMIRVLRNNGKGLVYVWAKDQNKDKQKSSYLKQNKKNMQAETPDVAAGIDHFKVGDVSLPVHTNRTQFKHTDVLVPWKLKNKQEVREENTFLRFYHVFEVGELEEMFNSLKNVEIVKSYYDQGNWCILFKKIIL